MHFVRFNGLRAPIGVGGPTVTVPTPFGPDFTNQVYSLSTTIKFDQPSFELQLLDSQDFYRGLTTPIKLETMQYLLDQGWPQQLILHLLVREIEVFDGTGVRIRRWVNYPESEKDFTSFQAKLLEFHGCEWTVSEEKSTQLIGPPLDIAASTTPEKLAAIKTAGAELVPVQSSVVDGAATKTFTLYQVQVTKRNPVLKLIPLGTDLCAHLVTGSNVAQVKGEAVGKPSMVFTLRSVEAVIYYLGELMRRQLDGTLDGHRPGPVSITYQGVRRDATTSPLFIVLKDATGDAAVAVEYDGIRFSIPKGRESGRSMHILSLLTQLVALQNKGTEQPLATPVRVVNP